MCEQTQSKMVRAGSITYFFDRKQTGQGDPYLIITASRFKGEQRERKRDRIVVFADHAQEFLEAAQEMIRHLG